MYVREENINRIYAMILTAIVAALLFLLCWLIIFRTPLPPYSEGGGGGIEVNFGNADDGFGNVQPEKIYEVETQPSSSAASAKQDEGEVLTQDDEPAPAIAKTIVKKDKHKKHHQEVVETETPVKKEEVKISEPVVNQNAIYKKHASSQGEGITHGSGDMGKPNGDPNSKNYYGDGGSGGGQGGGHGTGIGSGNGSGVGPGNGNGVAHFFMKDRTPVSLPKPNYNSAEQGKVVVSVIADRQGNIIRVSAGALGTTTSNQQLWKEAEAAAKRSKWTAKPDAPEEQKGTITYIFIRQGVL